jgi:hypothetical protein
MVSTYQLLVVVVVASTTKSMTHCRMAFVGDDGRHRINGTTVVVGSGLLIDGDGGIWCVGD